MTEAEAVFAALNGWRTCRVCSYMVEPWWTRELREVRHIHPTCYMVRMAGKMSTGRQRRRSVMNQWRDILLAILGPGVPIGQHGGWGGHGLTR